VTFAPRTWVVGETVTAAMMNTEIRDQINEILAAWTSFTPAWASSGTQPAIGNGSIVGRYMKVGRTCTFAFILTAGSTTTFGTGGYTWTLPFASANTTVHYLGSARLVSAQVWLGHVLISPNSSTCAVTTSSSATDTRGAAIAAGTPATLANGDNIRASVTYQTAT
jgi:hypothetical protein